MAVFQSLDLRKVRLDDPVFAVHGFGAAEKGHHIVFIERYQQVVPVTFP